MIYHAYKHGVSVVDFNELIRLVDDENEAICLRSEDDDYGDNPIMIMTMNNLNKSLAKRAQKYAEKILDHCDVPYGRETFDAGHRNWHEAIDKARKLNKEKGGKL